MAELTSALWVHAMAWGPPLMMARVMLFTRERSWVPVNWTGRIRS